MRFWYYFGVGEGIFQPFLGVQFQPGIKIIKDFSATDKAVTKSKKKQIVRESRTLNILLFCQEEGCTAVFTSKIEYEQHNLEGRHNYSAPEKGVMDRVKKAILQEWSYPHSYMPLITLLQTKVNMILILYVRFLLQCQYSKKQDGLCQLDLPSDILTNSKKSYMTFS